MSDSKSPLAEAVEGAAQMPQSTALAEADPASLQELLNRDPEGYQQQDLSRVIEGYRALRARSAAARAAGETGSKSRKRVAERASGLIATKQTEGDLGL